MLVTVVTSLLGYWGLEYTTLICELCRTFMYCLHIFTWLLASTDHETPLLKLRAVFQRLTDFGLRISPHKCKFGALSMEFLGHIIDKNGTAPLPEKVAAMRTYETRGTAKELR